MAQVAQKWHAPTPLYYAASYGLYHTAKSLITSGVDLNVRAGRYGVTDFHAYWRQRTQIRRLLVEAGADTTIRDYNGRTGSQLVQY